MLTIITFLCIMGTSIPTDTPTDTNLIKFTEMIMVEETSVPKPTITITNEKRK
jgi:hypothetical protein